MRLMRSGHRQLQPSSQPKQTLLKQWCKCNLALLAARFQSGPRQMHIFQQLQW